MHWDYLAILFVLAVIVPWRSRARLTSLLQCGTLSSEERTTLYTSTIGFQWAIALIILWRCHVHGLSRAELGIAAPNLARALVAATAISAVLVLNQIFSVSRLAHLPAEERGIIGQLADRLLPRARSERWVALALVLTVAICEELIYRGFIQSLLQRTLSSVLAGAVISASFFGLAHLYQGRRGVVTTFVVGIIFSAVRAWTLSLVPSMIIHFAVDFSAGVASTRLFLGQSE